MTEELCWGSALRGGSAEDLVEPFGPAWISLLSCLVQACREEVSFLFAVDEQPYFFLL
jgi:hypothetical protein